MHVGVLHPGAMGVSIASAVKSGGHTVLWASENRGEATGLRAGEHGLVDVGSVTEMARQSEVIISVCPPSAAWDIALQVAAAGFAGTFVDANAISPGRARAIGQAMARGGAAIVDAGIAGPPAWKAGTRIYLSGGAAPMVAGLFTGSLVEPRVIGTEAGKASALKLCLTAEGKATAALECVVLRAARDLGVYAEFAEQRGSARMAAAEQRVRDALPRAWRYSGEMEETALMLDSMELPDGFVRAAAEVFRHLSAYRDVDAGAVEIDEALGRIRSGDRGST